MDTNAITKPIDIIALDDDKFEKLAKSNRIKEIMKQVNVINNSVEAIVDNIEIISNNQHGWIKIQNKDIFYNSNIDAILPNLKTFELGSCPIGSKEFKKNFKKNFAGYVGTYVEQKDVSILFNKNRKFLKELFQFNIPKAFKIKTSDEPCSIDGKAIANTYTGDVFILPVHYLNENKDFVEVLIYFLKNKLVPDGLNESSLKYFKFLLELMPKVDLQIKDGELILDSSKIIASTSICDLGLGKSFDIKTIKKELLKGEAVKNTKLEAEFKEDIIERLLKCEKLRADIDPYDIKILNDPNRGHWDLWSVAETSDKKFKLSESFFARNPIADIKKNGTIGIDFGTKSTIVMFQDGSEHIMPMRVGTGNLSGKIDSKHYENPTALNFIDLNSFLTAYKEKEGRPSTKWEDLTSSHTAYQSLMTEQSSNSYYSFLYELKQWAGNKNTNVRIIDKKNKESIILKNYLEQNVDELDPIEIYAYYIGLYINNMHGAIYLDYILSYPSTYEKAIRDKLIESFSAGIRKSLPIELLKNDDVMKDFRVRVGASEPVAYAVCAMGQYGFEPEEDEKIFYGVFDFGGGTADFDFGLYREADSTKSDERRYDYVLESFGDSGDRYLGGENLLELLAFEVFKDNHDYLVENKISFTLPPECNKFMGSEILINESQEAKINMAKLMEKLRPYWEQTALYFNGKPEFDEFGEEIQGSGSSHFGDHEPEFDEFGEEIQGSVSSDSEETSEIEVDLIDNTGELKFSKISISKNKIYDILFKRIDRGVENFFESLILALNSPFDTNKIECINIFLAGNSSKSPILKEIFDKYITLYDKKFSDATSSGDDSKSIFKIYPPLGSEQAFEIQKAVGITDITNESPTGKTGVAYGLLKCRPGGKIKLVQEKQLDQEIKFKYFIGFSKKNKFVPITGRDITYDSWHEFIDASEEDFTIYYTDLPSARDGKMDIENIKLIKCRIAETYEDAYIFYRAKTPTQIEYVVAYKDRNGDKWTEKSERIILDLDN